MTIAARDVKWLGSFLGAAANGAMNAGWTRERFLRLAAIMWDVEEKRVDGITPEEAIRRMFGPEDGAL